jgi:hypothetical protein
MRSRYNLAMTVFRASGLACGQFKLTLDESALGDPTLRTGEAIAEPIMTIAAGFREQTSAMATTVLTPAHLVKDEPKKTPAQSPPQRLSAAWAPREGGTR